jgi:hypothetical protein
MYDKRRYHHSRTETELCSTRFLEKMCSLSFVVAVSLAVSMVVAACAHPLDVSEEFKLTAGPPSEFSSMHLPDVAADRISSSSALLTLKYGPDLSFHADIPVDGDTSLTLSFFSDAPFSSFEFTIRDPRGHQVPGGSFVDESLAFGSNSYPCRSFRFSKPATGEWAFRALHTPNDTRTPQGLLLVGTHSEHVVAFAVDSLFLHVGETLGIRTWLANSTHGRRVAINDAIKSGTARIVLPDSSVQEVPLNDDSFGLNNDPHDGIWGGNLTAASAGRYMLDVTVQGITPRGHPFIRTVTDFLNVIQPILSFKDRPVTAVASHHSEYIALLLPVHAIGDQKHVAASKVRVFAQVWGKDKHGAEVPICWVGGIMRIETLRGQHTLSLMLNKNWLAGMHIHRLSSLRNLFVQDIHHFVPIASASSVRIVQHSSCVSVISGMQKSSQLTVSTDMLNGPVPSWLVRKQEQLANSSGTSAASTLLLVHGYCAHETPFDTSSFTDYTLFQDLDANRLNDDFAVRIRDAASSFSSFGIVAHSQGGLASLHLRSFYWSPLDNSNGGRRLQTLASPYQGQPLAGLLAKVGQALGFLCGSNDDLTYDGARLWLASVPMSARKEVHYWAAKYGQDGLIHYCNLAANIVLGWPNDGNFPISSRNVFTILYYESPTFFQGWWRWTTLSSMVLTAWA